MHLIDDCKAAQGAWRTTRTVVAEQVPTIR
jgi:hypothetical protein